MSKAPRSVESYNATTRAEQSKSIAWMGGNGGPPLDEDLFKTWERGKKAAAKFRDPWIGQWQEAYTYTMPLREGFYDEAPAQDHSSQIFDETAVVAVPKLASRLAGGYVPEFGEIFDLAYGPEAPVHLRNAAGQAKLEALTAMIHECWQNSNLGVECPEFMHDLSLGTGNMLLEPGYFPGEVCFTSVDATALSILPDGKGGIKAWFWWRKMALSDLRPCYPRATFGPELTRALKKEPERMIKVECGYWRVDGEDGIERYQFVVVVPEFKKAESVVYQRIDEGPGCCAWSTVRWSKTGRGPWGRGPILLAMSAIKTCNITVELTLENAEFAIGGMWTYDDDGVFDPDSVTFAPGTFIAKSREGKIEPLQSAAQYDVSNMVLADMRQNIKRALHVDEMDKQGDTPYSAYEISQRRADTARDLTAPGSRITREGIVSWVNRTIWILNKQGVLDSIGLKVDGKLLKLVAKSPFLRGQDSVIMQEIMTGAGQVAGIFGPQAPGMAFHMQRTTEEIFRRNGIPLRLAQTADEIKQAAAGVGAEVGKTYGPGGPAQGGDPTALLAPLMKAGAQ